MLETKITEVKGIHCSVLKLEIREIIRIIYLMSENEFYGMLD